MKAKLMDFLFLVANSMMPDIGFLSILLGKIDGMNSILQDSSFVRS